MTNIKDIFFIEGGDNVGKTTLIENMKKYNTNLLEKNGNDCKFFKFPYTDTDNIDNLFKPIKPISKDIITLNNITYDVDAYSSIAQGIRQNLLMSMMIKQMGILYDYNESDDYIICDRGPLSTYLYNYLTGKEYLKYNSDIMCEYDFFNNFLKMLIMSVHLRPDLCTYNFIVLCRSPLYLLEDEVDPSNKKNVIMYKDILDNDKKLQNRIDMSINNLRDTFNNHQLYTLNDYNIKFHFVDICYDGDGERKSENALLQEVNDIIFKGE